LLEDQLEYDRERGDIAKKADEIVKTSLEEIQKVFYNILKKSPQIYKILENNDFYAIFY
jgi:hypothetical protein